MNLRRLVPLVVLVLLLPALVSAQTEKRRSYYDPHHTFGVGLQASLPYSDFADAQDTGYGIVGMAEVPVVPLFSLVGDVGWNQFSAKSGGESVDVWEFTAGGRFNLTPFFIGGEAGYYTEVDKVNWVPSMGLRFERLEVSVRWQSGSTAAWTTFRAGFYF